MTIKLFRGAFMYQWRVWGIWINQRWFIGISKVEAAK